MFDKREGKWIAGTKKCIHIDLNVNRRHIYFKSSEDIRIFVDTQRPPIWKWQELCRSLWKLVIVEDESIMYGFSEEVLFWNVCIQAQWRIASNISHLSVMCVVCVLDISYFKGDNQK